MGAKKSRKSPRAQVSLVARYRSPTAFEFVHEECFDLSAGGMFIKSVESVKGLVDACTKIAPQLGA